MTSSPNQRRKITIDSDTVALQDIAVFFGVPSQGHPTCYTHAPKYARQIKERKGIEHIHCINCGNPLFNGYTNSTANKSLRQELASALRDRWVKIKEFERAQGTPVPDHHVLPFEQLDAHNQWIDEELVVATLEKAYQMGLIDEPIHYYLENVPEGK